MKKSLMVAIGLFCFGQYISIAVGNIFLGFAILISLLVAFKNKEAVKNYKISKSEKGILIFIVVSFLLSFTSNDIEHSLQVFFNNYIYRTTPLFIGAVLSVCVLKTEKEKIVEKLINVGILAYTIDTCYIIYQALILDITRPSGIFRNVMVYAGWSCLIIPMVFILFMETASKNELWEKVFYGIALFLGLVGIVLNATRGAWLAVIIVLLCLVVYYAYKGNKKICAIFLTLCLVVPIGLYTLYSSSFKSLGITKRATNFSIEKNRSATERILLWKSAIKMMEDYPIAGVGIGEFGDAYHNHYISKEAKEPNLNHAHNNFFHMGAETGIVGLTVFLFMFYSIYKEQYLFWRRTKSKYALIIIASTTGLLLQGFTEYNFGDSAVIKNYWLILALCMILSKENDNFLGINESSETNICEKANNNKNEKRKTEI